MAAMLRPHAFIAFIALAAACAGADAACAQDSSAWIKDTHSALRLLAGSRTGSVLMGGIEILAHAGRFRGSAAFRFLEVDERRERDAALSRAEKV